MKIFLIVISILSSVSGSLYASDTLNIEDAWIRLTPPVSKNTAGYFKLINNTSSDVIIVSAESDAAKKAEIHDMKMVDGRMGMVHIPKLTIKAGDTIELKPGGKHLMLMGLNNPVKDGQLIDVTLNYSDGNSQLVTIPVKRQTTKRSKEKKESAHKGHH